jgi:hypothetical protein
MSDTQETEAIQRLQDQGLVPLDTGNDRTLKDQDTATSQLLRMMKKGQKGYVGWNPEDDPVAAGIVAGISPNCNCGDFGPHYIIEIDRPSGINTAVHCFHTVLKSQVERRLEAETPAINVGDLIVITYLGTKASRKAGHSDQNDYTVVVEKPE